MSLYASHSLMIARSSYDEQKLDYYSRDHRHCVGCVLVVHAEVVVTAILHQQDHVQWSISIRLITVHHTLAITSSAQADASYFMVTRHKASVETKTKPLEMTMKTVLSALVALTLVAGAVAPASAYEGFSVKTLDQQGRGGHAN
jgi:hypothetical protein